jgi:hypothetical protein
MRFHAIPFVYARYLQFMYPKHSQWYKYLIYIYIGKKNTTIPVTSGDSDHFLHQRRFKKWSIHLLFIKVYPENGTGRLVTFIPSLVPFTINRAGRNVVKARPVAETPAMDGKEGNMGRNVIIFYSIILYYIIYYIILYIIFYYIILYYILY